MRMIVVVEPIDCSEDGRCGKCWFLLRPDSLDPQHWCHQFQCHTDGHRVQKCIEAEETAEALRRQSKNSETTPTATRPTRG